MAHLEESQCDGYTIKWWKKSFQIVTYDDKPVTDVIFLNAIISNDLKDIIEEIFDAGCKFGIYTQQKSILECLGVKDD